MKAIRRLEDGAVMCMWEETGEPGLAHEPRAGEEVVELPGQTLDSIEEEAARKAGHPSGRVGKMFLRPAGKGHELDASPPEDRPETITAAVERVFKGKGKKPDGTVSLADLREAEQLMGG